MLRINSPKYLIIHHTGGIDVDPLADTSNQTFEVVNAWHRQNPNTWLGTYSSLGYAIGYHYFIDKKGKMTQGREDYDEGAHCVDHNIDSIGICMAGNFDVTSPTNAQISSLNEIIGKKMKEYDISINNVVPHRYFSKKTCYGNRLTDNWLRDIMNPPVEKMILPCVQEHVIIEEQKKQISRLQQLIQDLINLFKRR